MTQATDFAFSQSSAGCSYGQGHDGAATVIKVEVNRASRDRDYGEIKA